MKTTPLIAASVSLLAARADGSVHLLGFDHEKLIFSSRRRGYRLTDVAGNVGHRILA